MWGLRAVSCPGSSHASAPRGAVVVWGIVSPQRASFMPVLPPAGPVCASPRRANALARRDAPTPLGTSTRRVVAPLRMRMARLRRRLMATCAPAFPLRYRADRLRAIMWTITQRRPRALIEGKQSACLLDVLCLATRRPVMGDHCASPLLGCVPIAVISDTTIVSLSSLLASSAACDPQKERTCPRVST